MRHNAGHSNLHSFTIKRTKRRRDVGTDGGGGGAMQCSPQYLADSNSIKSRKGLGGIVLLVAPPKNFTFQHHCGV